MRPKRLKTNRSLHSENDLESNGDRTKTKSCLGEDYRVKGKKRKVSEKPSKSSTKRRGASKPVEVHGTKRKASSRVVIPNKRQKGRNTDSNSGKEIGSEVSLSPSRSSTSQQHNGSTPQFVNTIRANFEAKYEQLGLLGKGGFGSVYAGNRRTDHFQVAIKHIPKADVKTQPTILNGKIYMIPKEVLLMLRAGDGPGSVGKSATVSLLDWYSFDEEVLVIMERPVSSVDLWNHLNENGGALSEDQAKNIMKQLVEASIQMLSVGVFHRDIKTENILIATRSDEPRVRIIDFGCGCRVRKTPFSSFSGTSAYASPELFIKGKYKAGPTTVWQLGAVLFELLDGDKQFTTSEYLCDKIELNQELSQDCQDLMKMCLAVNPKERATLKQIQAHPWFK
ncbi:Serine/threonine-protein kinase pim-2 [Dissostichus eleginoides]|uniref:non-specific serine/threonine protein kinase n=1 Tax=Dissostichus eleginoides TaxID=100907 RepID=A0AAD9CDP6_DISEL|nr:Serine/threonine-protein kinase pim-2 [Dissostichus eleginoides]